MNFKFLFMDTQLLQQIAYLIMAAGEGMTLAEANEGKGLRILTEEKTATVIHAVLKLIERETHMFENASREVAILILEHYNAIEGPKINGKSD